jgi:hypothetical protein
MTRKEIAFGCLALLLFTVPTLMAQEAEPDLLPTETQPQELPDLFLPEIVPAATCTVTVQCQLGNISCTSLSGSCQASPPNECVVCDGVTVKCCSCFDCEMQCFVNYDTCLNNCADLPPRFCDRCDRILDRCLGLCPC